MFIVCVDGFVILVNFKVVLAEGGGGGGGGVHMELGAIKVTVQFRTEPMTDGIKRCWCMHRTMVCV